MAIVEHRALNTIGPLKFEVINLSDFDTGDEIETSMQNPQFGWAGINRDGTLGLNDGVSISFSEKTLTLTASGASGDDLIVFVFGF